ncbi:MAG TPA: alginate export family protein, partial [Polyangiaceae bacterium]
MSVRARRRRPAQLLCVLIVAGSAHRAAAQPESPPDGVTIGEFWFRPSVELRLRGEYADRSVDAHSPETPVLGPAPAHVWGTSQEWSAHARTRLGLSVERGIFSANLMVQDVRLAGYPSPALVDRGDSSPATGMHLAFIEMRSPDRGGSFLRVGRQEVTWGDGRLLGVSDWSPVPRALDAIRAHLALSSVDMEALAVLLSPPGTVTPALAAQSTAPEQNGAGAQLYGVDFAWHADPLFHAEAYGIARIARDPLPATLLPSDLLAVGARFYGDRAGVIYAAEGVYEAGSVNSVIEHDLSAWAATA